MTWCSTRKDRFIEGDAMTEPIRTDAQPTESDRAAAREWLAELREARTAWHESFGVPISESYARFLNAIGKVEDIAKHHAGERERIARLEQLLNEGRALVGCIADLADEEFTQEELDMLRAWSKKG